MVKRVRKICGGPLRAAVLIIGAAIPIGGCSAPPLDDARLGEVRLATPEDMAQYAQAKDRIARQSFGGVSFSNNGVIVAKFTKDQYDDYVAYMREHPVPIGANPPPAPDWPKLYISFSTRRMLIEPEDSSADVRLYLCDSDDPWPQLIGSDELMWRGNFITGQSSHNIRAALEAGSQPQEYEIIVEYLYQEGWENLFHNNGATQNAPPNKSEYVTSLPPPSDLCLARQELRWPLPSALGRPLRIKKEIVTKALGTLPRRLPFH